jgi:hypothetical protein
MVFAVVVEAAFEAAEQGAKVAEQLADVFLQFADAPAGWGIFERALDPGLEPADVRGGGAGVRGFTDGTVEGVH